MNDESASTEPPSSTGVRTEERKPGVLRRWLRGLRNGRNGGSNVRETLEELIEQHEEREDPIDARERQLIERILNVGGVTVEDIMVPRADIIAVECDTSLDAVIDLMAKDAHSRLPVYRDSLDQVVGMVHIKDVLANAARKTNVTLPKLVRPVMFVAPSMRVLDLLLQMRMTRTHMAMVVDEYGGVDGLLTIEDTVEQIVGEIDDEHDNIEGPRLEPSANGTLVADARLPIEEFESHVGSIRTEEERESDIDTLGGLVFTLAGRVPMRGEVVRHDASGLEFEVIDADPRRIRRLRICNPPQAAMANG